MHKKVQKLDRDFHKFLALLGLMSEHYGHLPSPSIEDVDKASPSARQWRACGAAADPAGHGRRAYEVSAQTATWRAKPRHRGAVELRRRPRSAPLFSAPLSAAIKKFKKSRTHVFFDFYTTVMLHMRAIPYMIVSNRA